MYANIIDNILNEPKGGSTKTAATGLSDRDLIVSPGPASSHSTTRYRAASSEDSLAEATMNIAARQQAKTASTAKLTIEQAIKVAQVVTSTRYQATLNETKKRKVASVTDKIQAAASRLQRLAAKTPAQMAQDGAVKLADYLNPEIVPLWAKRASADVALLIRVKTYLAATPKTAGAKELLAERALTDEEVGKYIDKLLNADGLTPKEVAAKLTKLAEIQIFNKGFATEKLRNDAGVVGYSFMEPNAYMDSCPSTYQRMDVKLGGVRAKSVKQIAACTGCTHFKQASGAKKCNLYQLPIVASRADLLPIINNLTPGAKTASEKKAMLVAQHNRETERPVVGIKQASEAENPGYRRVEQATAIRTASNREEKTQAPSFTRADALTMHQAGSTLEAIYKHAIQTVGTKQATATVRSFVAGLKGTKTKVALTQIDCTQLKGKLASSNGIVGAKKCATCTYRKGMHCGLTGGTLLNFPGMQTATTNHRIAAGAPKDGLAMMKDFEMVDQIVPGDIEITKPDFVDVELTDFSKVEL